MHALLQGLGTRRSGRPAPRLAADAPTPGTTARSSWSRPATAASSPTAAASAARTSRGTGMITTPMPMTSRRCSKMPESRRRSALVGFSMGGGEVARFLTKQGKDRVNKAVLDQLGRAVHAADRRQPERRAASPRFEEMTEQMKTDRAAFLPAFFKDFFGVGIVLAGQRRGADERLAAGDDGRPEADARGGEGVRARPTSGPT